MADRMPAEVFPPGEYIRDELEARGWTQMDLAFILNRPLPTVNEIIAGRKTITPETAKGLGEAFGTSAQFWLNLEMAYRLATTPSGSGEVSRRSKLYLLAPVKEMIKRGWIDDRPDIISLEGEMLRFFETNRLQESPDLCFAAKSGIDYSSFSPPHWAWLCRVRKLGRAVSAAKFERKAFEQGLDDLHNLTASEHDVRRVPRVLADIGVRLVLVEHLPKTRLDGAALWLDEDRPVVALSLRYDRIDHFWFTLYHELMHVRHGDSLSLDDALVGVDAQPTEEKPEFEQRADREAAEQLIPSKEIEGFISRVKPLYYKKRINQFANRIRVHPGIIVGQLQRRDEIGYNQNREMLVKVNSTIKGAALTDGWGNVPPIK